MSLVRAIDGLGDWVFGKGANDYKSANAAVSQNIRTRLQCFLGDCFFDQGAGLDWFGLLGAKNQLNLQLAISAVILNTANVTQLNQLSLVLNTQRNLTISYSVQTTYSTTSDVIQISI